MTDLDKYRGMEPDLDVCLKRIEYAVDQWSAAAEDAALCESNFKGYEASQKKALMGSGSSAVLAETTTRAHENWADMYLSVQKSSIQAERWKQKIKLEQSRFEAARSVFSATKKAVG